MCYAYAMLQYLAVIKYVESQWKTLTVYVGGFFLYDYHVNLSLLHNVWMIT